jgi:phosphatidylglycerophosphatase A
MNPKTEAEPPASDGKPRFSLLIATCFGIGHLPRAPGTWASLVGIALYWVVFHFWAGRFISFGFTLRTGGGLHGYSLFPYVLTVIVALVGVWSAGRVEKWAGQKDPRFVVIDEVSGQLFTYVFAVVPPNWKYLLLGFILFRVFDIWKPFPARQAESLPRGWGIMADDWVAAIYAALGMWLARAAGM